MDFDNLSALQTLILHEAVTLPLESLIELSQLKIVDLSNSIGLENSELIFQIKILEEINISHCHLISLPESIRNLNRLRILIINRNLINSIPEFLGFCEQLEHLNLLSGTYKEFPNSLEKLQKLKKCCWKDNNPKLPEKIHTNKKNRKIDIT